MSPNQPPTTTRLACKYLCESTFIHFGNLGFGNINSDLGHLSLAKLNGISNHPRIANYHVHRFGAGLPWRRLRRSGYVSEAVEGSSDSESDDGVEVQSESDSESVADSDITDIGHDYDSYYPLTWMVVLTMALKMTLVLDLVLALTMALTMAPTMTPTMINGDGDSDTDSESGSHNNSDCQLQYHAGPVIRDRESIQRWQDVIKRFVNCRSLSLRDPFYSDLLTYSYNPTAAGLSREAADEKDREFRELSKTIPRPALHENEIFNDHLDISDAYMVLVNIVSNVQIPVEKLELDINVLCLHRIDIAHLDDPAFCAAWASSSDFTYRVAGWRGRDRENERAAATFVVRPIARGINLQSLTFSAGSSTNPAQIVSCLVSNKIPPNPQLKSLTVDTVDCLQYGKSLVKLVK
ncbi:uncharacterized protein DSM5745_09482 [Aspergillus mulundensis]|uniref:Uncharacterized protein n=1 Tax=Aspergillus mulundensis TaxID=1810919 RepID=A0A3D8QV54_9EURO|nr:hypothetical protein DSM5745_09482 [Aspergillus mulundensis]RDW65743.1 hypothetical protein DSM5745_09482 [Aspergillus mulundensis]